MSVHLGWPLGTLAALVVGYVVAVVVVPPEGEPVPGEADATVSAHHVEVPVSLAAHGDDADSTPERAPPTGAPDAPPSLRGSRDTTSPAVTPDRRFVSPAEYVRTRVEFRFWSGRVIPNPAAAHLDWVLEAHRRRRYPSIDVLAPEDAR